MLLERRMIEFDLEVHLEAIIRVEARPLVAVGHLQAFEDARVRFDVRYYLVAIIFIVFDLEIAFFFPWAVSLKLTGGFGLIAMLIFASVLVVALVYDYRKGALEWD